MISIKEKLDRLPTIIAVDFDGTLCEDKYPLIGSPKLNVIQELKLASIRDGKIILWTCRTGDLLCQAVKWCSIYGLIFDAINDDIDEVKEIFKGSSRKVYADFYWDDKSVKK